MEIAYLRIDAFADRPFTGNPAAVCVLDAWPADETMQSVALEMNLSETAFVVPRTDGTFGLRWFTPLTEVDLCGHATLASAHALFTGGVLEPGAQAGFHTKSGALVVWSLPDGRLSMNFPAEPAAAVAPELDFEEMLGAAIRVVARNRMDFFVEVESADAVRSLVPDMGAIGRLPARGLIVTAVAGERHSEDPPGRADFVSRFFAPQCGVPEDPVTGSAHCALAPWWHTRLGRSRLVGHQLSRRGGSVEVVDHGERVDLIGRAVTVGEGVIRVA